MMGGSENAAKEGYRMLALLAASETGQADKFTALYQRYYRALCGLAFSILKEPQAAEDAVHNAFVNILKHLDKIEEIDCSKTRSFLIVITRREAYRLYNARKADPILDWEEVAPPPEGDAVWEEIARAADSETLTAAMQSLPEIDRQLLIGKYAYGYRYRELASLLGLSESNVSVRILRAKQKLVSLLKGGEDR